VSTVTATGTRSDAAVDGAHTGATELAGAVRFWGALVVGTLARAVLLLAACLLIGAALPALWGWVPTTVASGSMSPRIGVGDVVVAMPVPADRLQVGQVLLVDDPSRPGDLLLHRLDGLEAGGMLRLRGDANAQADASLVATDAVRGVGVLRVPGLGLPTTWQGGDRVAGAAVTALALLALLGLARLAPRDDGTVDPRGVARHRAPEAPAGSAPDAASGGAPAPGGPAVLPPVRRGVPWRASGPALAGGVVAVVAFVTVLFVVVGSSSAAFSSTTQTSATVDSAARFTCLDAPPPTQARFSYRYDDPAGTTVRDASGNGRTGTLQPGATLADGSCRPGDSPYLRLDGSVGSAVSTADRIQGPQVFTVETWFRTTTTTGGKLVGFGNAQTGRSTQYDRHLYMADSGALLFGVYSGSYHTVASPAGYADGRWHLATATLDGSGMKLYVDGSPVASDPWTDAEKFLGYWRVGGDTINGAWSQYPTSGWFRGDLDDTTVHDRAVTAAEVADRFSAGVDARSRR